MPSRRSHAPTETRGVPQVPPSTLGYPIPMGAPTDADLCERAVLAIWHSLDEHDLVDEQVRLELARTLEPLTALPLGDRPQRLIKTLRLPNPLDPSHLYWLTRRLLTLVPELQAAATAFSRPGGNRSSTLS
ncbi:hypothetical protein [Variovorax sp. GT1P44]|uniref:hypothetical protein n=1 Tax=Variovorax sp. GT1P44 TaxID=3443742 RepID=UPI003F448A65